MPFLPEDTELAKARKEAASAGFKSMTDAATNSHTAKAMEDSKLYDSGKALSHEQAKAWDDDGMSTQFRTKYGIGADKLRTIIEHPEMGKHITLSPSIKKEYDAYMAQTKKIAADEQAHTKQTGATKLATIRAETDIKAATTPTPRRAQD